MWSLLFLPFFRALLIYKCITVVFCKGELDTHSRKSKAGCRKPTHSLQLWLSPEFQIEVVFFLVAITASVIPRMITGPMMNPWPWRWKKPLRQLPRRRFPFPWLFEDPVFLLVFLVFLAFNMILKRTDGFKSMLGFGQHFWSIFLWCEIAGIWWLLVATCLWWIFGLTRWRQNSPIGARWRPWFTRLTKHPEWTHVSWHDEVQFLSWSLDWWSFVERSGTFWTRNAFVSWILSDNTKHSTDSN